MARGVAFYLLLFIFLIYFFSFVGFLIKVPIQACYLYLSALVCFACVFCISELYSAVKVSALALLIIVISLVLSGLLYDSSVDGRTYHQLGVLLLANGYNPVHGDMPHLPLIGIFDRYLVWVYSYPLFSEIVSAVFYKITPVIEYGKATNYILFCVAVLYSFSILQSHFSRFQSSLLSFLLSLTPVVVSQINTYNVDDIVSLLFLILILSILDMEERGTLISHVCFSIAFVCLSNVKFTGLVYACATAFLYFSYKVVRRYLCKAKTFVSLGDLSKNLVFTSFFLVLSGVHPYVLNLLSGENIFTPLLGENKVDIMSSQLSKGMNDLAPLSRLALSLFSKTQNISVGIHEHSEPELKVPFSWHSDEDNVNVADMRIAGFGHLFSGALLLGVLAFALCIKKLRFESAFISSILLLLFISLATSLMNPESWWARYVPQMYFIPIFMAIVALKIGGSISRMLSYALVLVLSLNMINPTLYSFGRSIFFALDQKLALDFAGRSGGIEIYMSEVSEGISFLTKLDEASIPYSLVDRTHYIANSSSFYPMPSSIAGTAFWNVNMNRQDCTFSKDSLKKMGFLEGISMLVSCYM